MDKNSQLLTQKRLVLYTVAVLLLLGAVSFAGIYLYSSHAQTDPRWTSTPTYGNYLDTMNAASLPAVAGIMVLLTLCIPRRLLRTGLLKIGAAVLLLSLAAGATGGLVTGLTVMLSVTAGVQTVSLYETSRGRNLNYRKEGAIVKLGSSLLHLGVVLLLLDLTGIPRLHPLHLPLFWLSTGLFLGGMVLSFFPSTVKRMV